MKRLALYGISTGLAISAWMYTEYLFGFHATQIGRYTGFAALIFTILGLYLGIKAYRRHDKAGKINYWETVFAGIRISLVAGLITSVFTFLYLQYINPDFTEFMVETNKKILQEHGATAAHLQTNAQITRERYSSLPQALRAFGGFVAAGSMFSLILAGILKSRRMTE